MPFTNHSNEDSKECYQEAPILPCQRDSSSLDLAMGPIRPEPEMHSIVL
jgi:hypothetical protein